MIVDFVSLDYYRYFLPIAFILAMWVSLGRRKPQIIILLGMSYLFFWLASGWHVLLLLLSTCLDWTAGSKMSKSDDEAVRKRWLKASLITNLGLLGVFKYLDFIIESLNLFSLKFSSSFELDTYGLLLPVGISFYTFQTMSYTIDIYRRKQKPYDSFVDFACYAAFFPQLVAGPIVRSDHFRKEIEKPLRANSLRFRLGLTLIIYGIAKKLVIADNVAIHANAVFIEGEHLEYWLDLVGYTVLWHPNLL